MEKEVKKNCYYCHLDKIKSEMQEIGVWVCNDCLEKANDPLVKKKK
jgi:ribosomal protein L37AE/L43A